MSTIPGEFFSLPLDELVNRARTALAAKNVESLQELDGVLRHRFYHLARQGEEKALGEFIGGMFRIVESPEARAFGKPEQIVALLTVSRHLSDLADAVRRDVEPAEQAARAVESLDREAGEQEHVARLVSTRKHASRLVELATNAGSEGIRFSQLADQLGISKPYLSKLLRELEARDVIERHRTGRNTYVCLGLAGQLLAERKQKPFVIPREEEDKLFGGRQPLVEPRKLLRAPA